MNDFKLQPINLGDIQKFELGDTNRTVTKKNKIKQHRYYSTKIWISS